MARASKLEIRETLLTTIKEQEPKPGESKPNLTQHEVLNEAQERFNTGYDSEYELAILTQWQDLFRTGYLGWGLRLSNPDGPFFHITERGRNVLSRLSRDPGNPKGYLAHVQSTASLNDVAESYLKEALACFIADLHKSAAVMIGAASESLILELRDTTVSKLKALNRKVPNRMEDWRAKAVIEALQKFLDSQKATFTQSLREEFEAYWAAFAFQIRTVRNDAGHPTSVDPVTYEGVHASFLVFPELAKLSTSLRSWVTNDFV